MPLETATYTSELVITNPAHTDGLNAADAHMRLTKAALKNTFPNFTAAALASTQAQIDAAVAAVVTGSAASRFYGGTVLLPGLTPVGDPNTGLWAAAADSLTLVTNGVARYNVDASGNHTMAGPLAVTQGITAAGAFAGGTGQLVPIGSTLIWWDDTLPAEGGYAWANGQVITNANTATPILLARWGNRFGGNGTTTMGVPDLRETIPFGKSTMGATVRRGLMTWISDVLITTLNGVVGESRVTLGIPEIPAHFHAAGITDPGHTHPVAGYVGSGNNGIQGGGVYSGPTSSMLTSATSNVTGVRVSSSNGLDTTANVGGGLPHNNLQPSTPCNFIIRVG